MALVALAAGALGACSADTMRFADPFGNPFAAPGQDPVMTGSVDPAAAAPTVAVASAPLSAPGAVAGAPLPTGPAAVAARAPAPSGPPGWSALGGTPIIVRQGETAASLGGRYNVPVDALLRVNGLASAAEVQPGRAVVIPVFNAAGGTRVASAAPTVLPAASAPPQTAASPAPTQTGTVVASAPLPPRAPARSPGPAASTVPPVAQSPARPPAQPVAQAPAQAPVQQPSAPAAAPTQVASLPSAATGLDFRWPARGRVISGFGTAGNEGINIAVPEGTPVRAAESGTVAYAGEELRGYGKLVLVRHDDGYVSAYAHNSELLVARGDAVRRGQVIANSGRTGNVTSPQLHFEIRQGADPVDPMPYLTN
ncbi:M23 family metallopeptidase [Salinarimonas rosea]|uniref:M23 family metallopeptidase n=1 Tax=Salinarimonas rosea TaxID=552063 RepID=UPI00041B496D|nr:M23 family metallopeptidase [Salinarimonas rosea]